MKNIIIELGNKIINDNYEIPYAICETLINYNFSNDQESFDTLLSQADKIRKHFNGDKFDLCTIVNAKSGSCSEDCRYCAQSSHYTTSAPNYPLMESTDVINLAIEVEKEKVDKFSLVTSGKGIKDLDELSSLEKLYLSLAHETNLELCASHGIISKEYAETLKKSGVSTYHHNLETSRNFYDKICTTHNFQERVDTCLNAKKVGLKICSGGIFGLGESKKDRLDLAFELKKLDVDSVPINILMPIEGTPLFLENNCGISPKEVIKTIAIYKFILPKAIIRYAGGRQQLGELQKKGIIGGVSGALTGNYLTTTGNTIKEDRVMASELGFILKK